jgi:hypothetical protein
MAAPVWKTPKGHLGTIQEQEFYELNLNAIVPGDTNPQLNFKIIAGSLPPGIVLDETTGYVTGRPKDIYKFRGVPFDVSQDVTSIFCCRVTNLRTNQVTDRTFSLTITGQDAPVIVNNLVELGKVFDGSYAEFQITAIDVDREVLSYYISNGALPPGMSLNSTTGIISGIVEPAQFLELNNQAGWSSQSGWDDQPWDHNVKFVSKRYEFDVSVTDTKEIVSKKFTIYVISKDSLSADNNTIVVNGYYDLVTADSDIRRNPVLLTPSTDLGVYSHDNYYAYKFESIDFDGDQVEYSLLVSENIGYDNETNGFDTTLFDIGEFELPPGLVLSSETGWLYGYIPAITPVQKEYDFGIYVYKKNALSYRSALIRYKLTIVGDLRYVINWQSPENLGIIEAGAVSELSIVASNTFNKKLIYSLKVGSKSRLPQGLRLLENGLIVGRASFEVTSFDKAQLTFDKNVREAGAFLTETTLDREYAFDVRVNDVDNIVIAYKRFRISLKAVYNQPYESLYLRALPGLEDKEIYNQVVLNSDVIPNDFVYRNGDPYFGKQKSLDVLVISGITPSTADEYTRAMAINHYRKKLLIGQPEIAQALDENGNVRYEVLYLPMIDDNNSAAKSLDLRTKIKRSITTDAGNPRIDSNYVSTSYSDKIVYPNSLTSMRKQIKNSLGYVDAEVLPTWMKSKQKDGIIPYWKPAMILAYLKPGTGEQVKFLINRYFTYDLKEISFEVDRYIWDCNLSSTYNALSNSYLDSSLTSFDADVRQGSDTLIYTFAGDGSTTVFDCDIEIDTGVVQVTTEKYITNQDSSLILVRAVLTEDLDYYRQGSDLILIDPPEVGTTIIMNYVSSLVITADYALSVPFNKIDGMTTEYIEEVLGGFDQLITTFEGKKIIFARQEQYPGYIEPNDGWVQNLVMWDDGNVWDDPNIGWDEYRIIPGYHENQADPEVDNERAGSWLVTKTSLGFYRLIPEDTIIPGQRVYVDSGATYGGKTLRYGPNIKFDVGETVPAYRAIAENAKGIETIFDGGSTRFVESINVYQLPDEGDKYLVFPRTNIFA